MNCSHCSGPQETTLEDYRYSECGLDQVILVGIERYGCSRCNYWGREIGKTAPIHSAIARTVALKPSLLTGQEVRFLRKYLGHSGTDYARQVGVTPETVSRWENEKLEMGWTHELLLRTTVLLKQRVTSYPEEPAELLAREDPFEKLQQVKKVRTSAEVCLKLGKGRVQSSFWREPEVHAA